MIYAGQAIGFRHLWNGKDFATCKLTKRSVVLALAEMEKVQTY
jgi:hypothetical protein